MIMDFDDVSSFKYWTDNYALGDLLNGQVI